MPTPFDTKLEKLMKSLFYIYFIGVIISAIFLSGCELLTKQPEKIKAQQPGNDLIISEVFTLSPDKYYNFSWIEIFNPTKAKIPWFYDPRIAVGLAVGSDGNVISTTDNAKTWDKVDMPLNYRDANLNGMSFSTPDFGLIVGDGGLIFKIIRANQKFIINDTIVKNPDPRKKNINDIYLLQFPYKAGILVGDSGLILRTANGGTSWTISDKGRVRFNLRSCWFIDLAKMYTVGDSGTIQKFYSGSWQKRNPPDEFPKTNFKSVFFFSDTGFVVGENGAIAGTKNAGESWRALPSNVTTTLRHVVFGQTTNFDRRTGWAVGDDGVILKSTNYGETWERKESETNAGFNHVSFVDDRTGFVFGEGGVVFSTSDGGETWVKIINIPLPASSLNSSYFIPIYTIKARERYVLEIRALRREFFTQINYANPGRSIVNFDVWTPPEVGMILIDPEMLLELPDIYWKRPYRLAGIPEFQIPPVPDILAPIFESKKIDSIMSGGFTIINNDSDRFDNHIKVGPGIGQVVKANIGYIYDSTTFHGIRWFLWDLLPSSEIRLVKYRVETDRGVLIDPKPPTTVDVVRWGYYLPDSVAFPGEPRWENNKPAGFIPEWYSLARYANDVGKSNPAELSTIESFYFAKDPIPRWNSQRRK